MLAALFFAGGGQFAERTQSGGPTKVGGKRPKKKTQGKTQTESFLEILSRNLEMGMTVRYRTGGYGYQATGGKEEDLKRERRIYFQHVQIGNDVGGNGGKGESGPKSKIYQRW